MKHRSPISRRDVLVAAGGGIATTIPRWSHAERRRVTGLTKPKKLLVVMLPGGIDDLYTVDPKEKSEANAKLEPHWHSSEILTHRNIRVAPSYHPLGPYLDRMLVLKGIQQHSVAHFRATRQIDQMRIEMSSNSDASLFELVGRYMNPQSPLAALYLTDLFTVPRSGVIAKHGVPILRTTHQISNGGGQREIAESSLASLALPSNGDSRTFDVVRWLISKQKGLELPKNDVDKSYKISPMEWPKSGRNVFQNLGSFELPWAVYALANNLAPVVVTGINFLWDTHNSNDKIQRPASHQTALLLKYLLDELSSVSTANGSILDETGVLVVSEMGRFPFVNTYGGKDHFPQISATLFGPGLVNNAFGATNSSMVGQKISFRRGNIDDTGREMTLDDLGRTLLEWVGGPDAKSFGYNGNVLDFVFS